MSRSVVRVIVQMPENTDAGRCHRILDTWVMSGGLRAASTWMCAGDPLATLLALAAASLTSAAWRFVMGHRPARVGAGIRKPTGHPRRHLFEPFK